MTKHFKLTKQQYVFTNIIKSIKNLSKDIITDTGRSNLLLYLKEKAIDERNGLYKPKEILYILDRLVEIISEITDLAYMTRKAEKELQAVVEDAWNTIAQQMTKENK